MAKKFISLCVLGWALEQNFFLAPNSLKMFRITRNPKRQPLPNSFFTEISQFFFVFSEIDAVREKIALLQAQVSTIIESCYNY